MRFLLAAMLAVAAFAATSCGGVVDPSNNVTENFSGTLEPAPSVNSVKVFPFSTSKSGEFSVKITALAPVPNVVLGVIYGQNQGGACAPFQNNPAVLNQTAAAGAITPGDWCVAIYDPGGVLTANETFTLSVAHP
jgi:hypothetical protein